MQFNMKSPLHMHTVDRRCDLPAVVGLRGLQWTLLHSPQDQRRTLPSTQKGGMKTKPSRVTPHKHERVEDIALGIVHVNALVCFYMLRLAPLPCKVTASHHHYRIQPCCIAILTNSSDLSSFSIPTSFSRSLTFAQYISVSRSSSQFLFESFVQLQ